MRADLAPLLVTALYVVPGALLLWALGIVRATPAGVLAGLGLAYVTGLVAVLLIGIALLCAGVPVGTLAIVAVSGALSACAGALALRGGRLRDASLRLPAWRPLRGWRGEHWIAAATIVALIVYATIGYRAA